MLMIYMLGWQGYSIPREFSGVSWLLLKASQAPLMECRASSLDLQAAFSESYFISDVFFFLLLVSCLNPGCTLVIRKDHKPAGPTSCYFNQLRPQKSD